MKKQNQYGNKKSENKKKKNVGRIIFNVLFYLVMIIFIAVLIFSFVEKVSGKDIYPFFGYRGMVVQTGSMSFKCEENKEYLEGHDEQFQINDLVFTRRLKDGEEPELYDIVTFKLGNATVIHRVVEITVDPATGEKLYTTRGDARPESDSPKKLEDITGIYSFSMGQFGVVVKFFQSAYGIIALIACLAIIIIATLILKYSKTVNNNSSNKNVKSREVEKSNPNVILSDVEGSHPCDTPTEQTDVPNGESKDENSTVDLTNQANSSTEETDSPTGVEESNPNNVISTNVEKSHPCEEMEQVTNSDENAKEEQSEQKTDNDSTGE